MKTIHLQKFLFRLLQATTVISFSYDKKRQTFIPSNQLYIYTLIVNFTIISLNIYSIYKWIFYGLELVAPTNFKNFIVVLLLFSTSCILLITNFFIKLFRYYETIEIANEFLNFYNIFTSLKLDELLHQNIGKLIFHLIIFPLVFGFLSFIYFSLLPHGLNHHSFILANSCVYGMSLLSPYLIIFEYFLYFLNHLKNKTLEFRIELYQKENFSNFHEKLNRISIIHLKLTELLHKIMRYCSFYFTIVFLIATINCVWQTYNIIIVIMIENIMHLPCTTQQNLIYYCNFILTMVFFNQFAIYLIHSFQKLSRVWHGMSTILANININHISSNSRLIQSVSLFVVINV